MMRIVHSALRRDVARTQVALAGPLFPDDAQRVALSEQLRWMTAFLHRHHESEDEYLYPMVRAANEGAAVLLDAMAADHDAIQSALDSLTEAVAGYERSASGRAELAAALGSLADVLLPHLRREEDEMMPIVSASITEQQWRDWDQAHNVKLLSPRELAFTGNWLLDDLGPADRAVVEAEVPPVPRWIIKNVLVRGYRKAAFRCWRRSQHSPLKAPLTGTAVAYTSAPPAAVWRVLSDITRVGEWSHECHTAVWAGQPAHAAVGARFRGSNRSGISRWTRLCTVTRCDEPSEFAYRTAGRVLSDETEWLFQLRPDGAGTRIEQHFLVRHLPVWADRLLWRLAPAHHDRSAALAQDLTCLAVIAERDAALMPTRATAEAL
jgi:Hemerythrin HHE cation binding domain/Polyketide cyclase / dehydrase and lipid transport